MNASAKKKILIIDDEVSFSQVLGLNLEATDLYEIREENDASKALETVDAYRPHLILLDVVMAEKSGAEIAIELSHDVKLKDIPIVFLTATMTTSVPEKDKERFGGHPAVPKPCELKYLLSIIEETLATAC